MKSARKLQFFGAVAVLGVGLALTGLTGCKSSPDLTQASALAMIQAKYDQTPAVGANLRVDELGFKQGLTAKYWKMTKIYPNKYWVDFVLTDDGKKVVKAPGGSDVIQWRPQSDDDKSYSMTLVTVAANHLKAHDIKEIREEPVPGIEGQARVASFTETVNLDGVPDPLQQIAHNPGNKLSVKRTANFALVGGAWTLYSIE